MAQAQALAQVHVTDDNLSPVLEILLWFCMIVAVLAIFVRLAIKHFVIHRIDLDDYLIIASGVFAVAQSIVLADAAALGVGQRDSLLSDESKSSAMKALYASDLLLITSLAFSKYSLLAYLRKLSPVAFDRKISIWVAGAIGIWLLTSFLITAFECDLPSPWDFVSQKCTSLSAKQYYIGIVNILTDIALIVHPFVIVSRLRVEASKKNVLNGAFAARIIVIIAIVCQMAYTGQALSSPTPLLNLWAAGVCSQFVQAFSIVTASTLYLKPFLDSLESGFIGGGDLKRQQREAYGYNPTSASQNSNGATRASRWVRGLTINPGSKRQSAMTMELHDRNPATPRTPVHWASAERSANQEWDTHSRSHIVQTTTWTIEETVREDFVKEDDRRSGSTTKDNVAIAI